MSQQKNDEIFKGAPNICGIVNGILIVEYDADGRDHNKTLRWLIQICWQKF